MARPISDLNPSNSTGLKYRKSKGDICMSKEIEKSAGGHMSPFERIKRTNDAGMEFWSSRDFAEVLDYGDYRNFEAVIEKAKLACFNSGHRIEDHFVDVTEMVDIGKRRGATRQNDSPVALRLLSGDSERRSQERDRGAWPNLFRHPDAAAGIGGLSASRRSGGYCCAKRCAVITSAGRCGQGRRRHRTDRLCHLSESWIHGALRRLETGRYSSAERLEKEPEDSGSHGQHGIGGEPVPRNPGGGEIAPGQGKGERRREPDAS